MVPKNIFALGALAGDKSLFGHVSRAVMRHGYASLKVSA